MKLLLIDNYDSFTYNLYYYFCELGITPQVVKNDFVCDINEAKEFLDSFSAFVLSPGPGTPLESGVCLEIIKKYAGVKKILGVCLGHQCIATAFNGAVKQLPQPLHAKAMSCICTKSPFTKGLGNSFQVGLYHSLYVSNLGECEMLGYVEKWGIKIPMLLKHKHTLTYGVQFHPESILTHKGKKLLENFLTL